jgi:surface antigen
VVLLAMLAQALAAPAVLAGPHGGHHPVGAVVRAAQDSHAATPPTGGYPYASAVCEFGTAGGPHCANPRNSTDTYDWGYGGTPGSPFRASDQWGYEYRNCTSYVAWRLDRAGVRARLFTDLGNASLWLAGVARERGVVVNLVPSPGAVAVWATSTGVGHVAWVDSTRSGPAGVTVTVSDYNYDGTGTFATHVVTASPSGYIHFPGA